MVTSALRGGARKGQAILSLSDLFGKSSPDLIGRRLKKMQGIRDVTVDCVANRLLVDFDPNKLTAQEILDFLKRLNERS